MSTPSRPSHLGRRYRPSRLNQTYDAVVIGSGMGGLTTAALLSDLGWKVAVLEQHYTAGGYTHSYEREGFVWDVGVHYIGDMGAATITRRLMDHLTDNKVQWAPMDADFDRFIIGEKTFRAQTGREDFAAGLLQQFPEEKHAIKAYLKLLDRAGKAMPWFTMQKLLGKQTLRWSRPLFRAMIPSMLFKTTQEVLAPLSKNPEFLAVLTGQYGDNGLPPSQSAFLIHALIARHYLYGGFYPEGGSWRIAEAMIPRIQKSGGEVFTYARVEKIVVKHGKVSGVLMQDGHELACPVVVSGVGVFNTFSRLIEPEIARQYGYEQHMASVKPSLAHLGVYVGLHGTAKTLGLPRSNLWIYPGPDHDASIEKFLSDAKAPFPVVYISFPSAKDPAWEQEHPGLSTLEVVAPAPYEWFKAWEATTWNQRGAEYEANKQQWGERLMQVVYQQLPQLQGKVAYWEVSTPLSTSWFAGWAQGELYGLNHDPQRFRQDWLRPETTIPGLWLTGQDILSCGVAGAMVSGVMTCVALAGWKQSMPLLRRIMNRPTQ